MSADCDCIFSQYCVLFNIYSMVQLIKNSRQGWPISDAGDETKTVFPTVCEMLNVQFDLYKIKTWFSAHLDIILTAAAAKLKNILWNMTFCHGLLYFVPLVLIFPSCAYYTNKKHNLHCWIFNKSCFTS